MNQHFLTTIFDMKHSVINEIDKLELIKDFDSAESCLRHSMSISIKSNELERINRIINVYFQAYDDS